MLKRRSRSADSSTSTRVRMVEVTPDRIVVKVDDFGDVSRYAERYEVTWPIPSTLREPRDGDPDPYVF